MPCRPKTVAVAALYHDAPEIITGDMQMCIRDRGGTAKFGYLLDANSAELVSRNRLEVTVTHVN